MCLSLCTIFAATATSLYLLVSFIVLQSFDGEERAGCFTDHTHLRFCVLYLVHTNGECRALFFVSSWCVNLIRVFLHDDTLHKLDSLHAS